MKIELAENYRNTAHGREAEALLLPCVQCGQCTFTCPTFRLLDDEWDGPRGRIWLIKRMLEGQEPDPTSMPPAYSFRTLEGRTLSANLQLHLDRCLSCRSCETSCPQDVRYGRLLDIGRELVEQMGTRPLKERLMRRAIRKVAPYRYRFTALLRTGQALRRVLPQSLSTRIPQHHTAGDWPDRRHHRKMLIWQGCVQPVLAPGINAAAARVLDRFGIESIPAGAGCCGALSHHMAAAEEARNFMRKTIDMLWPHIESGIEAVVLTASGCGMHMREYGDLLHDDPRYRDRAMRLSELTKDIVEIITDEWKDGSPPIQLSVPEPPRRIAFQSSCSLQHGERLNGLAETLLKRAGFKLVPVAYPFMCCGAAGTYSILQRELSESLRTRKLETLLATRPEAIATANIGCLTHLALASPIPVKHWIEILDDKFSSIEPH